MTTLGEQNSAFVITNGVLVAVIVWVLDLGVTGSFLTILCATYLTLSIFYIENVRTKKGKVVADKKLNTIVFFATAIVWWLVVCWLFDLQTTSSLIALAIAFPVSYVSVFLPLKPLQN